MPLMKSKLVNSPASKVRGANQEPKGLGFGVVGLGLWIGAQGSKGQEYEEKGNGVSNLDNSLGTLHRPGPVVPAWKLLHGEDHLVHFPMQPSLDVQLGEEVHHVWVGTEENVQARLDPVPILVFPRRHLSWLKG